MGFLLQFLGSGVAVAALVGLVAWARIAREAPPLSTSSAQALMAEEFPDETMRQLWISQDREAALAVASGETLFVVHRMGDGYAAHALPISALEHARHKGGDVTLPLGPGVRPLRFATGDRWPPFG